MIWASLMRRRVPHHREHPYLLAALAVACLSGCASAAASNLADFTSDGCSLFPDGTVGDRAKWCRCCLQHDIAYWRGGTEEERKDADRALRKCVRERTDDKALAETMYLGVRAGGHPAFPTWYRWAYGWPYGRGYQPLTDEERKQAQTKLDEYVKKHPEGYCSEQHRAAPPDKKGAP
jgi:hypothetical protein